MSMLIVSARAPFISDPGKLSQDSSFLSARDPSWGVA